MRSDRAPITVVAGKSSPVSSLPLAQLALRLRAHPVYKRLARIRWVLGAMLGAAVVGAVLLGYASVQIYEATAIVKIPVPFKLSQAKLQFFGTGLLETNGIRPGPGSRVSFTQSGKAPLVAAITAKADTIDDARILANAAAQVAVNQDLPFWDKVLERDADAADDARIALGMPHIAHHATVVMGSNGVPFVQTELRWQSQNDPLVTDWIAFMALFAGIAYVIAPDPNRVSRARQARRKMLADLKLQFSPAANADLNIPTSDQLPVVAGVELVMDLTGMAEGGAPRIFPILLDTSAELWNAASDSADGKELVLLRTRDSTAGSRAAVMAIGRAFSRRGKKTVMLDADITATLSKRDEFGFPEGMPGLLDILTREAVLSACLLEDEDYPGLSAICAGVGDVTDGYADILLESAVMFDLLDFLAERNDVILIHGPCGLDAGAASLAKRAGATLIVGPAERTILDNKAEARALVGLAAAQANILGRVEISRQDAPATQIAI